MAAFLLRINLFNSGVGGIATDFNDNIGGRPSGPNLRAMPARGLLEPFTFADNN